MPARIRPLTKSIGRDSHHKHANNSASVDRTRIVHDVQHLALRSIKPTSRNPRTHSKKQIAQIAKSIQTYGFTSAILVDERCVLIAGHARLKAAEQLRLTGIPAIVIEGLSDSEKRALLLADNRIAQNAGWDRELLASELAQLPALLEGEGLDIEVTGFEAPEIDAIISDFEDGPSDPADRLDAIAAGPAVSCSGDLWLLGKHRLICGDARAPSVLRAVTGGRLVDMVFIDPPYNVAIKNVVGRGKIQHEEFAMASGEMSREQFRAFLGEALTASSLASASGSVHYVCMDWAHIDDLLSVGRRIYDKVLNVAVWVKSNAGQGSFYRSQHEMIAVFRHGRDQHRNNVELGRHGRSRSNVWQYAGGNSFGKSRMSDLAAHPTVKPVAMVADAIKDCTRRDDIVLDTFCGSGTTILAAERVGRVAFAVEINPKFVDVAIRRWQVFTGKDAIHEASGRTFDDTAVTLTRARATRVRPNSER